MASGRRKQADIAISNCFIVEENGKLTHSARLEKMSIVIAIGSKHKTGFVPVL